MNKPTNKKTPTHECCQLAKSESTGQNYRGLKQLACSSSIQLAGPFTTCCGSCAADPAPSATAETRPPGVQLRNNIHPYPLPPLHLPGTIHLPAPLPGAPMTGRPTPGIKALGMTLINGMTISGIILTVIMIPKPI